MERSSSSYVLAILLLHWVVACAAKTTLNITTDQYALLAFKAHITSDPYKLLSESWSVSSSVCDWVGIICGSRHGRVTALKISNMGLGGIIPPQLGNLSFLASLDLNNNSFHGNLPPELARLRRLKVLKVGDNDLSGEVPTWLDSMSELRLLSLRNNSFSGLIPPSLANLTMLETMYLSYNSLEGTVPAEIGNMPNLKNLIFDYNRLSGSLPLQILNISTLEAIAFVGNTLSGGVPSYICRRLPRLQWLSLSDNKFNGEIPPTLSQCSYLQVLDLSRNNFSGSIPRELGSLEMLNWLNLGYNNLEGVIPKEFGNLTMLKKLSLDTNKLKGEIPRELGNLNTLEELKLDFNNLSGQIPIEVFNLSMVRSIDLNANSIFGHLPPSIGYSFPNLERLHLFNNHFSGVIPDSISNSSKLTNIELSDNHFIGSIPSSLGDLNQLQFLAVGYNNLTSKSSSQEMDFFGFLSRCRDLRFLGVDGNPMDGLLPVSIGNLSQSIQRIYVSNCEIKGRIPSGVGNLSNLFVLSMHGNQLTGPIPSTFQYLLRLQALDLSGNQLSGVFPDDLCGLKYLTLLNLEENKISGSIPDCIGDIKSLRYLHIGFNLLNSSIPTNLWNLKDLLDVNLSSNALTGSLSLKIENLKAAVVMDLSKNYFTGDWPSTIGDLGNLVYLNASHNRFQGSIPESIGTIKSLESLDLSQNNFSGLIPKSLENIQYLQQLNVSFNKLRGEIPTSGPFKNFTSESFSSNEALCGSFKFRVPPCPTVQAQTSKTKKQHYVVFLLVGMIAIMGSMVLVGVYLRNQRKDKASNGAYSISFPMQERISYYELLQATKRYDKSNLLGIGSFGTVYKATLKDGRVVAVKVFNPQMESAFRSFETECQVLRNLRHRNLTRVISSCSNPDFKALVLEFMPNGSLEKWLYSHNYFLNIMQRLDIMIDVAAALQYLHCGSSTPIVHCDLKPSNILLDHDMIAHVSDFGIAKLLDKEQSNIHTTTMATIGYVAPEHGLEGLVSTKCDVYSYGILLMEVFTRKKPSDEMFNGDLSLRKWVNDSILDACAQVIDDNLVKEDEEHFPEKLNCLTSIIQVALYCSVESPRERSSMQDVLRALNRIKLQLLSYYNLA